MPRYLLQGLDQQKLLLTRQKIPESPDHPTVETVFWTIHISDAMYFSKKAEYHVDQWLARAFHCRI